MGIQRRTDGENMGKVGNVFFKTVLDGKTEGKIPTEGKAHDIQRALAKTTGNFLCGGAGLPDQGAVEEPLVEMMGITVVAKVETKNIETQAE